MPASTRRGRWSTSAGASPPPPVICSTGAPGGAWTALWARHAWLGALFARDGWTFTARWPARPLAEPSRFAAQYWRLVSQAGAGVPVFCPVGRLIELYGPQRLAAARALGLRPVRLPRAGFAFAAGFPRWLACEFARRAVEAGFAVVLLGVDAAGHRDGLRPPWPARLFVPRERLLPGPVARVGDGRRPFMPAASPDRVQRPSA